MKKVTIKNKPSKNSSLGERIQYIRTNHDSMKQEDLAKKIGRKRSEVAQWESGNRTPDYQTIRDIAIALKVSSDYLLGITEFESANIDYIKINEMTGLSSASINILQEYIQNGLEDYFIEMINFLIEHDSLPPNEDYACYWYDVKTDKNDQVLDYKINVDKFKTDYEKWEKNQIPILSGMKQYYDIKVRNENIYINSDSITIGGNAKTLFIEAIVKDNDFVNRTFLDKLQTTIEKGKTKYLEEKKDKE